jgi:hypothetical protein
MEWAQGSTAVLTSCRWQRSSHQWLPMAKTVMPPSDDIDSHTPATQKPHSSKHISLKRHPRRPSRFVLGPKGWKGWIPTQQTPPTTKGLTTITSCMSHPTAGSVQHTGLHTNCCPDVRPLTASTAACIAWQRQQPGSHRAGRQHPPLSMSRTKKTWPLGPTRTCVLLCQPCCVHGLPPLRDGGLAHHLGSTGWAGGSRKGGGIGLAGCTQPAHTRHTPNTTRHFSRSCCTPVCWMQRLRQQPAAADAGQSAQHQGEGELPPLLYTCVEWRASEPYTTCLSCHACHAACT